MPTQRFLNLKEEKRQAIVDAAVREFSRVPYSMTSINRIVKDADISRGSFYTYFEDKDDLLRYVIGNFQEQGRQKVLEILDEKQGDLIETVCTLLRMMIEEGGAFASRMYRNTLTDANLAVQSRALGFQGVLTQDPEYKKFIHQIYEKMDRRLFPVADEDTMSSLGEILILLVTRSAVMAFHGMADTDTLMRSVRKQLEILKDGASCRAV